MFSKSTGWGFILGTVIALMWLPQIASADYPQRPVTLVVPYGAGGNADVAARALARVAPEYLGSQVTVVNRTGAGGVVGSRHVMDSKPDGYTLLMARVGSQAVAPALNPSVPYNWDDFTIIGMLEINPYVCVVSKDSPIKDFEDLKAALKRGNRTMNYATSSVADASVVFPMTIFQYLGLERDVATMIPYEGASDTVTAVMGGHVDFTCNGYSPFASGLQSGDLRALVVSSEERLSEVPDAPTAQEVDMPSLELVSGWSALYGPPGLSPEVVDKWVEVLEKVSSDDQWISLAKKRGSLSAIWSPDRTAEYVEAQYTVFRELGKSIGMVK